MGIMSAGGGKDRGQYQYAGGIGDGNDGTQYIAFNAIPEGEYRSKGESWAPEIRCARESVENYIVSTDLSGITSKVVNANRAGVMASVASSFGPVCMFLHNTVRGIGLVGIGFCSVSGNTAYINTTGTYRIFTRWFNGGVNFGSFSCSWTGGSASGSFDYTVNLAAGSTITFSTGFGGSNTNQSEYLIAGAFVTKVG